MVTVSAALKSRLRRFEAKNILIVRNSVDYLTFEQKYGKYDILASGPFSLRSVFPLRNFTLSKCFKAEIAEF